ncbi:auxin-responsive protein IAA13-like [Cucurbita pepo subsp. pepo]|uniref:auxin-responsive protein IAA13-like n=1 Tax=Cucurbita pepo subsp. pepo TaxID=3664 RepID=UPI000C9D82E1|nr:auxin-responsive protein IAA13-like [Cucurbita pepo subsp. pepo]
MSTVSRDESVVLSSEDESPDESEIELGLGLSLGVRDSAHKIQKVAMLQFGKILTAEDFPASISSHSSISSSSSSVCSSSWPRGFSVTNRSKINSDSAATTNGGRSNQVVGWPPIRASRISTLANQAKPHSVEGFKAEAGKNKNKHTESGTPNGVGDKHKANEKSRNSRNSLYVKVNMDGVLIGRKVNLSAYSSYETLAQKVENMFLDPTALANSTGSSIKENDMVRPSRLLNGLSEYMLTYEDRDGDWMLVGDVPWGMFTNSVKRLRIMRAAEANQIDK